MKQAAKFDLVNLCCDRQEQIIAKNLPAVAIKHISRFPTREERQFALRCFWIPFELVGYFEKQFCSPKGRIWDVWQFAPLVAHGRMLKEMCAWDQDPRVSWWKTASECEWWMRRYDSYLRAIDAAYCHWVKHKCPDCSHEQPELAAAARYGFIHVLMSKDSAVCRTARATTAKGRRSIFSISNLWRSSHE